jgi:2-polyprenyl-6-methoxyphenol hydroxylase-like FAD-dependent oxidoreductase
VYEAAAELKEIGAGVALHPNAMKVLRAIGVEDDVRRVAGRSKWQVMRRYSSLDALHEALAWLVAHGQADVGGQPFPGP